MDKIEENNKKNLITKNEKIYAKKDIKEMPRINKIINVCSRCGGEHFDLSCIYYKV